MAEIIDQIVKISIQDAISSVSTTDVNTVALVGLATTENAEVAEIASVSGAVTAYGSDSELTAMVKAFFAQDSQPSKVVCIPAGATAAATLSAVETAASSFDFYHVVLATYDTTFSNASDWQTWLADAKKVLHVQVSDATDLKSHGNDRIAVYQHTELTVEDEEVTAYEFLNVAIVALRCASDSARGSFAHKKCSGVTADSYTVEQYNAWIEGGINIYVKVSGEARLFMGTTADNETFIDQIVKDDWIRFNVQSRIYKLLGEANDGHGVNYDDAGIAAVAASVLNVLTLAQDTDHQYVMADSASVDYKTYDYLKENYASDVRARNLPLITGNYARMNAIQTVVQVSLYVTL